MSVGLSKTLKDKDMNRIFTEVKHRESLGLSSPEQLRLFHLIIRDDKFYRDDVETWLYRNISRYVFSRAKLEQFRQDDDLDAAIERALQMMRENGAADEKGKGNELGEMMVYAFLEGKLKAYKLMSRVELTTDLYQYKSIAESIHMLSDIDDVGSQFNQMVFGTSSIVGDLKDAIDNAFEAVVRIKGHSSREIQMVEKTVFDRLCDPAEIEYLKRILIPEPNKGSTYDTAYGLFLGYTMGIDMAKHPGEKYEDLVTAKMAHDIRISAPYIAKMIAKNNLSMHSFYIYILPLEDAEQDKLGIMDNVMKGAIVL